MAQMNIEVIPTGALSLDIALGVGGIPRGRIIEIYGPESSGKTTVALHMVAQAQKLGGIAGFVDAEHALDPQYAKQLGVDIDNLYIHSRITENRGWKSRRQWYVPAPWILLLLTPLRRWFPKPRSMAKWAIPMWDCRPALCLRPSETSRCDQQIEVYCCFYQSAA